MSKRSQSLSLLLIFLLAACQFRPGAPLPSSGSESASQAQAPGQDLSDLAAFSTASIVETVEYHVQERFVLVNEGPGQPDKQNLWVALIGDIAPYQSVSNRTITPQNYRVFSDEFGNQIAEFDLTEMPAGAEIRIQIDYRVRVNRLEYELSGCAGELPDFFTLPELHIESNNPQIIALAEQLSESRQTACEQVRAFYDHIGDHLVYSDNGENWGAQAALGEMGADCTEYAALMVALSRAAGIPARYMEGVLFLDETTEELARREHAWLDVYLPGIGWTPMDPTLGRSSLLRERYFAAYPPDRIIVTRGGSPSALRGASYYSHIYWPGKSAAIKIKDFGWSITPGE